MPRQYAPEEDSLFHVLQEQPDLLIRVRQRRTALKVLLLPAFIIFWCHALMQNLELRPKFSPFDLSWMAHCLA